MAGLSAQAVVVTGVTGVANLTGAAIGVVAAAGKLLIKESRNLYLVSAFFCILR